jgi:YD repeat-containing protein
MKFQRFTGLLLAFFVSYDSFAQTSQQKKLLPMLAPSSPEAASLGRYGSYQVNLFTGVPDISVPIYEVQVGELKLPISLSYHASGIKVTETASRAGLGWSLDAGGTITRKIQGKPDEQANNYFAATPTSEFRVKSTSEIDGYSEAALDYLSKIDTRYYDGEPDIFSYSFPGHSGRFLFNQKDNFTPFLIPYAPLAVSKTYVDPVTTKFSIKDEGGCNYLFNTVESTSSGSGVGLLANTTSAWLLSDIVSANLQDSIRLKYSPITISDQYENEYFIINDNVTNFSNGYYTNDFGSFSGEIVNTGTVSQRLDSITFSTGKIVFEQAAEGRTDFNGIFYLQNRLKFIKVYSYDPVSKAYTLVKIFQLFHSYFLNGSDNTAARLRLDSIQAQTAANSPVQTYRFSYNTNIVLPAKLTKQKDYWGYYNARTNTIPNTNTPTSIPKTKHTYVQPPGAPYDIWIGGGNTDAREPDPFYMQACILQQITFPTGGYTQFEYETNQYLDDQSNPKYAGGLRIKSIKSYTAAGAVPIVKTYKYGANELGYGRANFFLEQHFFVNHQNCRWVDIGHDQFGYCRTPPSYKTMHTYFANPSNDIEGSDGSPVVYPVVTEYQGDNMTNNGKTIYRFSDKADAKTSLIGYGKPYFDSYQFVRGLLTNKSVYKTNGGGSYTLLSEQRKGYQFFTYQWSTGGIGIVVRKLTIDQGTSETIDNIGTNYNPQTCFLFSDAYNYNYNNYNIVSGDNKLVADSAIVYDQFDPSKSLTTITNYTYDDLSHLAVTQVQTTNSRNELLKTTYTYPYNIGTAPYTSMNAAHIWDKSVTETNFNGSTQLVQQTSNYSSYAGNNYLPANITVQIKTNPTETRALFNTYDTKGNILEMQQPGDVSQSYIWDYKGTQPIAEITGASQTDVAYTSFEADGSGGWSGTVSANISTSASFTGKRSYNQTGFSFSRTALSTSTTYIVSYWSKNGAYNVNSVSAISGRSVNGWTYYEHSIANPAGGTITVSGSGIIDELRLYPKGALMTTYTYELLIGLTTQCDANNRIQYYNYDDFGRLSYIRDQDNNVIKKICYNYWGQPENCEPKAWIQTWNKLSVPYTITLTNTATNAVTTYSVYPSGSAQQLGQLPLGTYNITLAPMYSSSTTVQLTYNGITQQGISFTINNLSINADILFTLDNIVAPCSFTMNSGFSSVTNSISNNGNNVTFSITFTSSSTMFPGSTYNVATINGSCRPASPKNIGPFTAGGRTWTVTVSSSGQMSWQLSSGSSQVNPGTPISSGTLNYTIP